MQIISHRYLTKGKDSIKENTLSQLKEALGQFDFFETDIRRLKSGEFYISHDPQRVLTPENDAFGHVKAWKESGAKIMLNIKELGYEKDLVEFLNSQGVANHIVLFDFDIEALGAEPNGYISRIHALDPKMQCAVRVSDRNETTERALGVKDASAIWLDEYDGFWVTKPDLKKLKASGKSVICVAPDLHGAPLEDSRKRCLDFLDFGGDAICTDFAEELLNIVNAPTSA